MALPTNQIRGKAASICEANSQLPAWMTAEEKTGVSKDVFFNDSVICVQFFDVSLHSDLLGVWWERVGIASSLFFHSFTFSVFTQQRGRLVFLFLYNNTLYSFTY